MDSERNGDKQEEGSKRETSDPLPNALSFLQPTRIRRNIQGNSRLNRFLLAYSSSFLPYCGIISWILFLLLKN